VDVYSDLYWSFTYSPPFPFRLHFGFTSLLPFQFSFGGKHCRLDTRRREYEVRTQLCVRDRRRERMSPWRRRNDSHCWRWMDRSCFAQWDWNGGGIIGRRLGSSTSEIITDKRWPANRRIATNVNDPAVLCYAWTHKTQHQRTWLVLTGWHY